MSEACPCPSPCFWPMRQTADFEEIQANLASLKIYFDLCSILSKYIFLHVGFMKTYPDLQKVGCLNSWSTLSGRV